MDRDCLIFDSPYMVSLQLCTAVHNTQILCGLALVDACFNVQSKQLKVVFPCLYFYCNCLKNEGRIFRLLYFVLLISFMCLRNIQESYIFHNAVYHTHYVLGCTIESAIWKCLGQKWYARETWKQILDTSTNQDYFWISTDDEWQYYTM